MNEKDLFRGKRIDNNEWAVGCRTYGAAGECVIDIILRNLELWEESHEVDPDTVGQCTGMKDKRKKLIFDGDIVKMYFEFYGYNAVVEWDSRGSWVCRIPNFGKNGEHTLIRQFNYFDKSGDCFNIEIIGNIHDNPEIFNKLNLERSVG